LLKNLKKNNGRFRYLLKNVIAKESFLLYAYKTMAIIPNYTIDLDFKDKTLTKGVNIKWFVNLSETLKNEKFSWNCSREIYTRQNFENSKSLNIDSYKNKIVQKAIYLVLLEIYENRLHYFSTHSHGYRPSKNRHSALHEIKFGWQAINWYLKFDLKKAFYSLKQKTLIKLLKVNIYDKALFSLLHKIFQVKVLSKEKKELFYPKNYSPYNNLLTLFLSQIYLSPLDNYAKNLSKEYSIGKKFFGNCISSKLTILIKKRIIPSLSNDLNTQPRQTEPSCLKNLRLSYMGIYAKIKHIRYANAYIFGILSNKKWAVKCYNNITSFIQHHFFREIALAETRLINVFHDSIHFLSCRIYCTKKEYAPFFQSVGLEKKHRIHRKIKIKNKIILNKNLKKSADNIWHLYQNNPYVFLSAIVFPLQNKNFAWMKKKMLAILKLNRRKGIRELSKFLMNEMTDKHTKMLSRQLLGDSKTSKNFEKFCTKTSKRRNLAQCSKNYIIDFIKWYYGDTLFINKHKTSYLIRKLREKFHNLIWPPKMPRLIALPPDINWNSIHDKNKITHLASIIVFLTTNQQRFDKKLIVSEVAELEIKKATTTFIDKTKPYLCQPIINADLTHIYHQLKKNEIVQKNRMKVNTKKSLILYEDYKIIQLFSNAAASILNYFSCCDNFSKVKSIVYYFVRLSLATTIMQKHKMSSTYQVFKEYGENVRIKHPWEKKYIVHFLTKNEIYNWPKGYRKKNKSKTHVSLFENINSLLKPTVNLAAVQNNRSTLVISNFVDAIPVKRYKRSHLCWMCAKKYSL
jgi:Type II intron maturase